jgi:hypothetical protein
MDEIRSGLWRWVAKHPAWRPGATADSADDWPEEVGCVAYAGERAFVLVDPLIPDPRGSFLPELDALVERHDQPVCILQTVRFHRRSRDELERHYGPLATDPGPGVEPIPIAGAGETMVWLPEVRTLVPGDRLIADGHGGLRMSPDSWMRYLEMDQAGLARSLEPLRQLGAEIVLVSHGDPVLQDGQAAIDRAIGG